MGFAIAIDGPSGAGKSTLAKNLAKILGYTYIDTGAMYRAVGYYCQKNNISTLDCAEVIKALDNISIEIKYIDKIQHIYLNGCDVTEIIRTQQASENASRVSVIQEVREKLVELQRHIAKDSNVVMDGRDIGSVVLPHADIKIFLTADVLERGKRRVKELKEKGFECDLKTVIEEIEKRDLRDRTREQSPLIQAEDAIMIDCGAMNEKELLEFTLDIVRSKEKGLKVF